MFCAQKCDGCTTDSTVYCSAELTVGHFHLTQLEPPVHGLSSTGRFTEKCPTRPDTAQNAKSFSSRQKCENTAS